MKKFVAAFYDKHPVITVILAVVLAINLIPLAVVGVKLLVPLLLLVGLVVVIGAFTGGALGSAKAKRQLSSR